MLLTPEEQAIIESQYGGVDSIELKIASLQAMIQELSKELSLYQGIVPKSSENTTLEIENGKYNINIGDQSNGNTVNIVINSTQGNMANGGQATPIANPIYYDVNGNPSSIPQVIAGLSNSIKALQTPSILKNAETPINIFQNGIRKISLMLTRIGHTEHRDEEIFEYQQSGLNSTQALDIKRFEKAIAEINFQKKYQKVSKFLRF
jgi:hypothetical protein